MKLCHGCDDFTNIKCYLLNFFIIFLLFSSSSLLMSSRSSCLPILALLKIDYLRMRKRFLRLYWFENQPCFLHHDWGKLIVLHTSVVEVFIAIFPLIIPIYRCLMYVRLENCMSSLRHLNLGGKKEEKLSLPEDATNFLADVDLSVTIIYEVVKFWIVFFFTFTFYSILPAPTAPTSLKGRWCKTQVGGNRRKKKNRYSPLPGNPSRLGIF